MLTDLPELESPLEYDDATSVVDRASTHHSILLLFTFLWGSNFVLAEVALRELAPISFSVSRFLVAGAVMVSLFYMQGIYRARKEQKAFSFLNTFKKKIGLALSLFHS